MNNEELILIKNLKNNMNLGRTKISEYKYNENCSINSHWILGFIIGEGTFGLKNLVPYFQVAQHNKNKAVLYNLNFYLSSIPKGINTTKDTPIPSFTIGLNKKQTYYLI